MCAFELTPAACKELAHHGSVVLHCCAAAVLVELHGLAPLGLRASCMCKQPRRTNTLKMAISSVMCPRPEVGCAWVTHSLASRRCIHNCPPTRPCRPGCHPTSYPS